MDIFVTVMGWLAIVLLCAMGAGFGICMMAMGVDAVMSRYSSTVSEAARRSIGREIKASAHWFAESQDTGLLLRLLGDRIINNGTFETNQLRNDWRDARKKRDARSAQETGSEHGPA